MDSSTAHHPTLPYWKSSAVDDVAQYLEVSIGGQFKIALLDDDGCVLHARYGSQLQATLFDAGMFRRVRLEIKNKRFLVDSLDTQGNGSLLFVEGAASESMKCVCMRLVFSDSPHIRWLTLQTAPQVPDVEINAISGLLGKLIVRERDAACGAMRSHETIREQAAVINHISDGLLVLDPDGVLKYCNSAAAKLLNFSPQACIGRPLEEALDFKLAISAVFKKKEGYLDRELQIDSPSLHIHLIDTAIPILDESGEIVSVVNTFRQIDRVKELSYRITVDRSHYRFSNIIGSSEVIKHCVENARKAALSDANIVLFGESGTGKEIFAQAIHAASNRAAGPFVAVNCASLPRDLVESELFGYMAGSFTGADKAGRPGKFELASGGTLFLDEIAEMPLDVQAKLLRVLQERRVQRIGAAHTIAVDLHVIAASHRRLAAQVADGQLREDLYYRLNVIEIDIPALRERVGDIPILVETFLKRYGKGFNPESRILSEAALQQLVAYRWPGNIRELQNMIERLIHLSDGKMVDRIPAHWFNASVPGYGGSASVDGALRVETLIRAEERAIRGALEACGANVTRAAQALGITRPTLYAKMKRYGLFRGSASGASEEDSSVTV